MRILALVTFLLVAFLLALLAARLLEGKLKTPGIGTTRAVAIVYVVIAAATTLYRLAEIAMSPSLEINMPVAEFWPVLPESASVQGPTAQVVGGGVTRALVEVQGLAASTRWLLGTGVLLQGVAAVFIGAAVFSMCNGYLRTTAFRPVAVKWFSAAALVIVVCGLGWQVTEGLAGYQASQEVLRAEFAQWDTEVVGRDDLNDIIGLLRPADFELFVNFWPIGAGLGLFATAQIFKRGLELQKETAGLI